jgi:hypothetical protein
VEGPQCLDVVARELISDKIERHAAFEGMVGAHPVDRPLHLAMVAVSSLDGIGRGRKQRIVQECERLLDIRTGELLQRLAHLLEPADPLAESLLNDAGLDRAGSCTRSRTRPGPRGSPAANPEESFGRRKPHP